MGCPTEVEIGDNLVFSVTTHDPDTGVLTDADAVPSYRIYEDETAVAILNGNMAKLDDANTTGFYTELIACTAGNGFENGKTYTVYIEATVDGDEGGICYAFKAYDQRKANVTQWLGVAPLALVAQRVASYVGAMANNAITAAAIAANAITNPKIAAGAIAAAQIAADAITSAKVQDGFITEPKIGPNAITSAKIAGGAITAAKIATDALGADELAASALTEIQAAVAAALVALDLDHLLEVSRGAEEPVGGTYFDDIMHKGAGQTFDPTTDSLEAIRDTAPLGTAMRGTDGASTHAAADVWAVGARTLTSFGTLVADIWAAGARTLTDKTGFSLSAAGIQAIWDALTANLTTVGSIGKLLVDNINATISSRSSHGDPDPGGLIDAAISSRSSHAAADIWAVGARTLTSFGTLVNDIWTAVARTLTDKAGFSLAADQSGVTIGTVNTFANAAIDSIFSRTTAAMEGGVHAWQSLYGAIAMLTHFKEPVAGKLRVYESDDSTALKDITITTDPLAEPITAMDPD